MRKDNQIDLEVTINGTDKALQKAEKLVQLLEEAKSLVDELASTELKINLYE